MNLSRCEPFKIASSRFFSTPSSVKEPLTNNSNTDSVRINGFQNTEQYNPKNGLLKPLDGCTDSSPVISQKEPKQTLLEKIKELKN